MKVKFLLHIIFISAIFFAQNNVDPNIVQDPIEEVVVEISEEFSEFNVYTTEDKLKESYVLYDSIDQRNFEANFQENYTSTDYDYTRTKPRESLWSKIKRRIEKIFSYFFRSSDASTINNFTFWVMRIVAVGIVGLVLYWLLSFILRKDGTWFFSRNNKDLHPEARTITENIHKIDLNALITKYEAEDNYRFAIRYRYLKLLKIFNDKGFLTWDPDKTNLDYIKELNQSPHKTAFSRLTHIFDYVWYGDFPIDADAYAKYKEEFHSLIENHE